VNLHCFHLLYRQDLTQCLDHLLLEFCTLLPERLRVEIFFPESFSPLAQLFQTLFMERVECGNLVICQIERINHCLALCRSVFLSCLFPFFASLLQFGLLLIGQHGIYLFLHGGTKRRQLIFRFIAFQFPTLHRIENCLELRLIFFVDLF